MKKYCIDTNVFIEDPNCIDTLLSNGENEVYLSMHVISELDNLKKRNSIQHVVFKAIENIKNNFDKIKFLDRVENKKSNDKSILDDILNSNVKDELILVTNDKIFQLIASIKGVNNQEYKSSIPFKSDAQSYDGVFNSLEEAVVNSFYGSEDDNFYFKSSVYHKESVNIKKNPYGIVPKTLYQAFAIHLMMHPNLDLVSINSEAGYGKTHLSLACAFQHVFQNTEKKRYDASPRKYNKIYIIKPVIEIGKELGSLPGTLQEKIFPYMAYLKPLVDKLTETRKNSRIYENKGEDLFNKRYIEVMPINYLRGCTLSDCIVIVDEAQGFSRFQMRTILSRLGENVKCYVIGDTNQIDSPFLNSDNNGINWVVKTMKGHPNYAHLVLKGKHSRGPIADMVRERGL